MKFSFKDIHINQKNILHGISGEFRSGELTAIMGPSGSGKTTLLHILAGYKKKGYTGQVLINDVDRFESKEKSCYIMQEDSLQPLLTIKEIMLVCAHLKLGDAYTTKAKTQKVEKILDAIGLLSSSDTMTGKLSGGQRKRLGIALELIDNPPVMFFDEPTSGLDSSSTRLCITMLQKLAREDRAIVCTLHQPSALIFEMFDHLYCLADGKCCYSGDPTTMNKFLGLSGFDCPPYHNPADFLLEVIGGEFGNHNDVLIESIQNGKNHSWRKTTSCTAKSASSQELSNGKVTLGHSPLVSPVENLVHTSSQCKTYNTSFRNQLIILVRRNFTTLRRDKFHMYCRLVMHLFIGALIGMFFFNIGTDAGRVFNNFSLIFFSTIFLAFSALQSMIISFPLELPVVRMEHFNRWYSVIAYYLSNTLADLPIQVGCAVAYCTTVYWMSGQPHELYRFCLFTFICVIVSLLAQSIGYFIGSSMRVMNGVIFGPMFIMPWVMMSGYFIQMRDAPNWAQPFFHMSYLRHGIKGLAAAIYGYSRGPLPCLSEDYCHYVSPEKVLKELDMVDINYGMSVLVILCIYVGFKIVTYFVLVHQLKNKR